MTVTVIEPETGTALSEEPRWPCSWEDCPKTAVAAARFHGQAGHVHDCARHIAELREWHDVAEVVPLPCPWSHGDGRTWTDSPRELT